VYRLPPKPRPVDPREDTSNALLERGLNASSSSKEVSENGSEVGRRSGERRAGVMADDGTTTSNSNANSKPYRWIEDKDDSSSRESQKWVNNIYLFIYYYIDTCVINIY